MKEELKSKIAQPPSPLAARMIEDEAAERIKKRLRDMGLIVNAGTGKRVEPVDKKNGGKK